MKWNNTIHSFNLEGKRITRADNTLVCICEKKEDADKIALVPEMIEVLKSCKCLLAELKERGICDWSREYDVDVILKKIEA